MMSEAPFEYARSIWKWLQSIAGVLAALSFLFFPSPALGQDQPLTVGTAPALGEVPEYIGEVRIAKDVTGQGSWFKRAVRAVLGLDDTTRAMVMPNGVHVDAQGRILVADTRAQVVHVFDPQHRHYQVLRAPTSDPFLAPIAVATDSAGRIYVTDSVRSRIFVFSPEGKFLRTIGGIDKEESIFQRATGITIDTKLERMYVVDTLRMCVLVLSAEGKMLQRIGKRGSGPGEFNYPTHIALGADGTIWVADSLNFRVQHFDSKGNFLSMFGRGPNRTGELLTAKGIAVDAQERIYVVEGRTDRVRIYDPMGRMLSTFGQTGRGKGEFFLPSGIATGFRNEIVVADSYNGRVEIFRLSREAGAQKGGQ